MPQTIHDLPTHPLDRGRASWRGRSGTRAAAQPGSSEKPVALAVGLADELRAQCGERVALLHHRRGPGGDAIEHLAVSPSGVWVLHGRVHEGRVGTARTVFGEPRLTINGRRRPELIDRLALHASAVRAALREGHADVQVRSALCFVDTAAPLLPTAYLGSYLFFGTPAVSVHLNSDGPVRADRIGALAEVLERGFPAF